MAYRGFSANVHRGEAHRIYSGHLPAQSVYSGVDRRVGRHGDRRAARGEEVIRDEPADSGLHTGAAAQAVGAGIHQYRRPDRHRRAHDPAKPEFLGILELDHYLLRVSGCEASAGDRHDCRCSAAQPGVRTHAGTCNLLLRSTDSPADSISCHSCTQESDSLRYRPLTWLDLLLGEIRTDCT
jgi:hypothetical protein